MSDERLACGCVRYVEVSQGFAWPLVKLCEAHRLAPEEVEAFEAEAQLFAVACMDPDMDLHHEQVEDAERAITKYRKAVDALWLSRVAPYRELIEAQQAEHGAACMYSRYTSWYDGLMQSVTDENDTIDSDEMKCECGKFARIKAARTALGIPL